MRIHSFVDGYLCKTTTGKNTFKTDAEFYSEFLHEWVKLDDGTVFNYKISSMKDGKKITLTYESGTGDEGTAEFTNMHGYNVRSFSGKIHISGSNSFSHISKIDCFYGKNTSNKIGFYLREN